MTSSDDTYIGTTGSEIIYGGGGNDTLTGGGGSDTFTYTLGETGNDVIKDFSLASLGTGGDVLDLRDLLVGETANATSLDAYLDFSAVGTTGTLITVHADGQASSVGQTIVLENVSYAALQTYAGGTSDAAIITKLLVDGHLKTDI